MVHALATLFWGGMRSALDIALITMVAGVLLASLPLAATAGVAGVPQLRSLYPKNTSNSSAVRLVCSSFTECSCAATIRSAELASYQQCVANPDILDASCGIRNGSNTSNASSFSFSSSTSSSSGGIVPDKHRRARERRLARRLGGASTAESADGSCHCPHAHTIDGHASSFPYLLFMLFSGVAVRSIIALMPWHPPYTVLMGLLGLVVSAVKTNSDVKCGEFGKSVAVRLLSRRASCSVARQFLVLYTCCHWIGAGVSCAVGRAVFPQNTARLPVQDI